MKKYQICELKAIAASTTPLILGPEKNIQVCKNDLSASLLPSTYMVNSSKIF